MRSVHKNKRNIHGVIFLDKPASMSSNKALQKVRQLFNAKKAGHTGSLDPLATGMLPICFGESTKFSQFLLNSDKIYRVIAKLGQRTNTSDSYGEVISERIVNFTEKKLESAICFFKGNSFQTPSMYSAIKYKGLPLYKYARKGIVINRPARLITVHNLKIIRLEKNELELEIHCLKGTYIRTIIDDLGEMLGCGAHVIYLRRLQVGNYSHKCMITLEQLISLRKKIEDDYESYTLLLDSLLLPIDTAIMHLPIINLTDEDTKYFKRGQSINIKKNTFNIGQTIRVLNSKKKQFLGIALISKDSRLIPKRLII
ncbi:tRNA pseudouridine synthase B [Candidatus Providencia siddallii]|uniref:tRNA pseudouridine synthase B n=1 Tax=Candidatus Providencia siddallii TaxID=1715285 RepID=A0A0M6W8E5_9GAMM|nr:tRNA pseudouridine synthase B [Candidatus Providencia siddallii]